MVWGHRCAFQGDPGLSSETNRLSLYIGTLRGGKGEGGRGLYFLKQALLGPHYRH